MITSKFFFEIWFFQTILKLLFAYAMNCFVHLIAINPKKLRKEMISSGCVFEFDFKWNTYVYHKFIVSIMSIKGKVLYCTRYDADSKNDWKELRESQPHWWPVSKRSILTRDKQRLCALILSELFETEFSVYFSLMIYQCFRILKLTFCSEFTKCLHSTS